MTNQSNDPGRTKGTIRSRLLAARRACAPEQRAAWAAAACEVLVGHIGGADVIAAYASFGTEPDTGPLLARLRGRGIRVLLPILENDMDLSWGRYSGPDSLVRRIPPGGTRPSPIPEPAESLGLDEPTFVADESGATDGVVLRQRPAPGAPWPAGVVEVKLEMG